MRGQAIPNRPPIIELFLDMPVVREIAVAYLGLDWVEPGGDRRSQAEFWKNWVEVYHRLGYDFVRVSGGLDFPTRFRSAEDTADSGGGTRLWAEEGGGPISSWKGFEQYPWPNLDKVDLWHYEFVANNLPDGMGLMVCPTSGFFEIPLNYLFGYENLCYLLYDNPDLLDAVFRRTGELIYGFYEQLLGLPGLRAFFQGDDMGYKTGTLIASDDLRKYILPWHKKLARLAHDNGLLYFLHACGNIDEIMKDLMSEVGIDGRHSFEDEGNSVIDFKQRYGNRVAVLGGIDMDKLCRLPEDELRRHVRLVIEKCLPGGRFALGSGNTVANYVPIPNYLAMLDEAFQLTRA